MVEEGLISEVKGGLLEAYPQQPTALQALGYKEIALYLRGAALPLRRPSNCSSAIHAATLNVNCRGFGAIRISTG